MARPGLGMLSVLQALVGGAASIDADSLAADVVERALDNGLGPVLARVCGASARVSRYGEAIEAADLTSRLLTAEMLDGVSEILGRAAEAGCELTLLKGCSTCLRYYPEPHLRTMGDVDLLVRARDWTRVEALLRDDGFDDAAAAHPRAWYEQHHHSVPLWHPERRLTIELHTHLYPPESPMVADARLMPDAVEPLLTSVRIGDTNARVFTHELQLVYTATRWAKMPDLRRGVFPMLDAALLITTQGATLNWPQVCGLVDGSWGSSALRVLLTYLDRWGLAPTPAPVLRQLARADRFTNRVLLDALHRMVTIYVIDGRPLGRVMTSQTWRAAWSTLVGPTVRWKKPLRLATLLAFPGSKQDRFAPSSLVRRFRSVFKK